ncbi:uncharacterized protein [Neodiprion pinetum]|uniref:uncharacterized protein n=1 Tax=Neodiprion pinetum TaxID=441929 RepID=UPI00370FED46
MVILGCAMGVYHTFNLKGVFFKHNVHCMNLNKTKVILPAEEDKILKFKDFQHKETVPFCVYAELECLLQPTHESFGKNSTIHQKHLPYGIAYYLHCAFDDSLRKFKINRGETCIQWFVNELKELAHSLDGYHKTVVPMEPLNFNQIKEFDSSAVCHICEKPVTPTDVKHQDHCHFTGKYRAAAHRSRNLNDQNSHTIPVIFHNLSGYDSLFLTKAPGNVIRSSLNKFRLLTGEGVFPYEYIDSWEKLEEKHSPAKKPFYSKLNVRNISDDDYAHACDVWQTFNVQTLEEYSDLYSQTDVFLLADVFQDFLQNCWTTYKLDSLNYYTAPVLSFNAMLKCTGIELELLTDIDIVMFIEKDFRQCDVLTISDDAEFGYLLKEDLEYPAELHETHKYSPLCPEHYVPPIPNNEQPELTPTLFSEKNYVVHYSVLQQCLQLGSKLFKIHRVLKFRQTPRLKKYIDLNTDLRRKCHHEFEKNFYNVINNAVFGKTMGNVRKYRDVRLITERDGPYNAEATIADPDFHDGTVFDREMIIVEMSETKVELNKPFLIYNFTVPDIYKHIKKDLHKFDTSDYPLDNVNGMPQANEKVLGSMKDGNNGKIMLEFVGLGAKL